MRGAPENIAKAVVLEALRTAHRERRGCLLIAFGGPDELIERELRRPSGRDGLHALLDLIGQSFDGGTDVQAPIERAIAACARGALEQRRPADRQRRRVRLHAGHAGAAGRRRAASSACACRASWSATARRWACWRPATHIHWVRDWRRFAGDTPQREGFVPVHSASLTALYFPNALNARASATAARRDR